MKILSWVTELWVLVEGWALESPLVEPSQLALHQPAPMIPLSAILSGEGWWGWD